MKQAIIDLGSNSVKCIAIDCSSRRITNEWSVVARLGEQVALTGMLGQEAIIRNLRVILDMVKDLRDLGITRIRIIGTMALREALDGGELCERIQDITSIIPEILEAEDEARLSFEAALNLSPTKSTLVIDIGGGSTELSLGSAHKLDWNISLSLGAVTLSSSLIHSDPCSQTERRDLAGYIAMQLQDVPRGLNDSALIGVGGSLCTLAALHIGLEHYDSVPIHGSKLSLAQLNRQIEILSELDLNARRALPGMQVGRAESILAGAMIAQGILVHWSRDEIIICAQGWRHALICKAWASNPEGENH